MSTERTEDTVEVLRGAPISLLGMHHDLAWLARQKLAPRTPTEPSCIPPELERLASEFLVEECSAVEARAAVAPREPAAFVAWFEDLKQTGPGQDDALFPYL